MVSPPNDAWKTSAEIPYWMEFHSIIDMEFLRSFLRRHFAGKPVVVSPNVGCFLRLQQVWIQDLKMGLSLYKTKVTNRESVSFTGITTK